MQTTATDDLKREDSSTTTDATDLTAFQRDILTAIAGYERGGYSQQMYATDAPHGLAIKRTLEGRYGEEINHGRLYPNLDQLVDDGLIEKGDLDRRTHSYELTDDGWYLLRSYAQWIVGCLEGANKEREDDKVTGDGPLEEGERKKEAVLRAVRESSR